MFVEFLERQSEGMAVQSMLGDLGLSVTTEMHTDRSACRGISYRRASGNSGMLKLHFCSFGSMYSRERSSFGGLRLQRTLRTI